MRVKSVSDLAFKTLDELTDDEDELWIAHIVFDDHNRTGDIQRIMKQDCGTPYYTVQGFLKRLVDKNVIQRVRIGVYAPNLKMLLPKMLDVISNNNGERRTSR